jgi:hypothetical protein
MPGGLVGHIDATIHKLELSKNGHLFLSDPS